MNYIFKEQLNLEELNELLKTNNWDMDLNKLEETMKLSWGWLTGRNEENKLVGFVQVLSDSVRHAYIMRLIVHKDHRSKGIGTNLMKDLMEILESNNLQPTLVATPGNAEFYAKLGFDVESNGYRAMCIRKK